LTRPPTALRAFLALVWFSARRQGRVRQVGWVGFALLGVTALVVAVVSRGEGWRLENRTRPISQTKPWLTGTARPGLDAVLGGALPAADEVTPRIRPMTAAQYASERLPMHEAVPGTPDDLAVKWAVFAAFRAVVDDPRIRADFAFTNYSRWVVFSLYVSFLLPLFTLAYASGAIGAEREGRTLLWLITRPLPRWAVYLAKLLGMLPWCVGVSGFAFAVLGLAGGEQGLKAVRAFWPLVVAGGVAFGCVFHMVGALFRRPTIVGLVYVFFFEVLVANLPGGLKQFSLNYYLKSLFYHWLTAAAPAVRPEGLETYQAAEPGTAWAVLLVVSVAVTAVGAWLFGRQEPKDET
jgi:ABC-type transport system involved in multi-copper enzyme maturation permease subunit